MGKSVSRVRQKRLCSDYCCLNYYSPLRYSRQVHSLPCPSASAILNRHNLDIFIHSYLPLVVIIIGNSNHYDGYFMVNDISIALCHYDQYNNNDYHYYLYDLYIKGHHNYYHYNHIIGIKSIRKNWSCTTLSEWQNSNNLIKVIIHHSI